MMALLCQESGRQKAGNGWESRKGSGEAWGGGAPERDCVSPGEGRGGEGGQGAFTVYLSVSTVQTSEQSLAPHPGIVLCCLCASLMSAGGGGGRDVCSYLLHSER